MNLHAITTGFKPLQPHFLAVGIEVSIVVAGAFTRCRRVAERKKHGCGLKRYPYKLTTFQKMCEGGNSMSQMLAVHTFERNQP